MLSPHCLCYVPAPYSAFLSLTQERENLESIDLWMHCYKLFFHFSAWTHVEPVNPLDLDPEARFNNYEPTYSNQLARHGIIFFNAWKGYAGIYTPTSETYIMDQIENINARNLEPTV